jgi:hypothetical protein
MKFTVEYDETTKELIITRIEGNKVDAYKAKLGKKDENNKS